MPCSVPSNSERCVGAQVVRQAVLVNREPVVLAGDHDLLAGEILHRVVGAVVTEFHLHGLAPLASASSWWPRQMPKTGMPASRNCWIASIA